MITKKRKVKQQERTPWFNVIVVGSVSMLQVKHELVPFLNASIRTKRERTAKLKRGLGVFLDKNLEEL